MPFDISAAPEEFQRRMEEAFEGLYGIKPIQVDIQLLIYGCGDNDKKAHDDYDRKLEALL